MIHTCPRCDHRFKGEGARVTCPHCSLTFAPGAAALESVSPPEDYLRGQLGAVTAAAPAAGSPEAGACYQHPHEPAIGTCEGCNRPVCEWCNVPERDLILCETCFFNDVLVRSRDRPHRPSLIPSVPYDARQPITWELRSSLGRRDALQRTWWEIMLRPAEFFRRMPLAGDRWSPLIFALSWAMLGLLLRQTWRIGTILLAYRDTVERGIVLGASDAVWPKLVGEVTVVLLVPAIALAMYLAEVAAVQTLLLLVGERHARLLITWRLAGYAAAPWALLCIPFLGIPVAVVTHLGVLAAALRQSYHLNVARAWIVSSVPYALVALVWYRVTLQEWAILGYQYVFGG